MDSTAPESYRGSDIWSGHARHFSPGRREMTGPDGPGRLSPVGRICSAVRRTRAGRRWGRVRDVDLWQRSLGLYVRSLTARLVRQGTLDDYVYLEHGAHYAIGALSVILLVTIQYEIHEVITGLIGVVLIGWSFLSSVRRNRGLAAAEAKGTGSDGKAEAPSGL